MITITAITAATLAALSISVVSSVTGAPCAQIPVHRLCWGCLEMPYQYLVDPPGVVVGSMDPSIKHVAQAVQCATGLRDFTIKTVR